MLDRSAVHLPDLPNDGYETTRARQLSDAIMLFMRDIERNRGILLEVVIGGLPLWRKRCEKEWRGFRMNRELTDEMFRYLTIQAALPNDQRELIRAAKSGNADTWRDAVRRVMPSILEQRDQVKMLAKWSPFQ